MNSVRPFAQADVPAVAGMFQRILRNVREPASPDLESYLADIFLGGSDGDITSSVYLREDGAVAGFMGVMPMTFLVRERLVRAAVCGTFMVDGYRSDPFAGARLMRAFLAGPQDISLSETANDISTIMWRKMNAAILPGHSLEWLCVFQPASFLTEMAASKAAVARILSPLARPADALLRHINPPAWRKTASPQRALPSADTDDETTADLFIRFTESFAARPHWQNHLHQMIAHARRKALYGSMVRRVVYARNGEPVGLFLYYGDRGRIGRAVQVLAGPGQTGAVIDSMLADADRRGLTALRGRTMPVLLEAMMGGPFLFLNASSSIVHARDPALAAPFLSGEAFFNGFAGESWSRLIGDRFG